MSESILADEEVATRIKACIIYALELECSPEDIKNDTGLFEAEEKGGLGLDSLAALEIFVRLAEEFHFSATEVDEKSFANVAALTDYVRNTARAPAPE